jgi:RNA polymerase sigma-70 factor (ECF subfamily)
MARAGNDYATADTTTVEHASTTVTTKPEPAGRTKTEPQTSRTKSPGSRSTRAKAAGSKATAKIKTAGRKTAARLKGSSPSVTRQHHSGTKPTEEAATDVAASADAAVVSPGTVDLAGTGAISDTAVIPDTGVSDADDVFEADDAEETDELTAAVEGAQRGDSESFRILYREVQPKLLRYLSFLVDNDAEDIASETWLQATRDLHKFQGNFDNFRGWITTIGRHRAMDHLRKQSRQPPAVPVPVEEFSFLTSADDTEARAIESVTTDDAVKLISSLPKDQAEAVMLRAVVGMDAKTAAAVVGKRAGAIRTAAYRGLKTLAKRLGADAA